MSLDSHVNGLTLINESGETHDASARLDRVHGTVRHAERLLEREAAKDR